MIIDTTCGMTERKMKEAPIIVIKESVWGSLSDWVSWKCSATITTNDNVPITWEYTVPSDGVSNWTISTDNFNSGISI